MAGKTWGGLALTNNEPAVLLCFVFVEIYPLYKWLFSITASFIKVQMLTQQGSYGRYG